MPGDLPPEGWYRDPDGGPRARYWDGTSWTGQYADPQALASAEPEVETSVAVAERPDPQPAEPEPEPEPEPTVSAPTEIPAAAPAAATAPAGWYRDPAGSDARRYWDGSAWTADLEGDRSGGGFNGLGVVGLLTALFMPIIGLAIGAILVSRGQRRDGWIVVGIAATVLVVFLVIVTRGG